MNVGTDCPLGIGYLFPDGRVSCRCTICARCNQHTGNTSQGHFWSFCRVTGTFRTFHACCPNDCELESAGDRTAAGET